MSAEFWQFFLNFFDFFQEPERVYFLKFFSMICFEHTTPNSSSLLEWVAAELAQLKSRANWTILSSDISLDTHGIDVMIQPRVAVVLEVLISMMSLSLVDQSRITDTPRAQPRCVVGRTPGADPWGRVVQLKDI